MVLLAELIRGKEGSQPGPASVKDDVPVSPIIGVRTDIIECIAHVSAVCTNTVKAGLRKPTATFQIHTDHQDLQVSLLQVLARTQPNICCQSWKTENLIYLCQDCPWAKSHSNTGGRGS